MRLKSIIHFFFLSLSLGTLIGCRINENNSDNSILVQVNNEQLTRSQLEKSISAYSSSKDSLRVAQSFINQWIKEKLLYEKAYKNIGNLSEINEQVEQYKRQLIIYEYENKLLNERLSTSLSDEDLQAFYKEHLQEFKLKEPVIKGLFLKVPSDAPQLKLLKKWLSHVDDKVLEKIEKYSLQNAIVYEYFSDHWVSFGELMKNIPYEINSPNQFLKGNKFLEVTHDGFWYYLSINSYLCEGQDAPFDYIRPSVTQALLNQKKKDFMQSVETDLYNRAVQDKKIIFSEAAQPSFE